LGPATTKEIALHTGQPLRQVSAVVRHLRVQGLVDMDPASIKRRFILTITGINRTGGVDRSGDWSAAFAFGRRPFWVQDILKSGGDIEKYRIW